MHRIYYADVSQTPPTKPSGGQRGYPTATPVPTVPGPYWYHMVTEEIISAILAGGVALDEDAVGQLGIVITSLVQSANANAQVLQTISGQTMPYGALLPWPGPTPPSGYIKANGILLDRSGQASYPKLTDAVLSGSLMVTSEANWVNNPGTYTLGDGASTIRIPDGRGLVLKGHHDGSPTRTTNTTRALGSYEGDVVGSHNHAIWGDIRQNFSGGGRLPTAGGEGLESWVYTEFTGGIENLVRNMSVLWCVRAY